MKYESSIAVLYENGQTNIQLLKNKDKCDKWDYIAAVACGAVAGVVDVFCVDMPATGSLTKWTDSQTDKVVKKFAKFLGWKPKEKNIDNVNSAIGFLEKNAKINYDQRKPSDVGNIFNIAPNTHHMMSLGHSPDIVGLFFSILNQFTSTSSFISDGTLITVLTDTFELRGGNFIAKLFCGFCNWLCHLMSDIAGSSGSHNRGTGITAPLYEFFGFCKFGSFSTSQGKKDLAEIAQSAFSQGKDFRHFAAESIPVLMVDLSIKLIWGLRRYFQYHKPLKDCIPNSSHEDLRIMLLFGNGVLCVMDGIDAGIRSGGNFLLFFMRLNLPAWFRLATLVLHEILIRSNFDLNFEKNIAAYQRITDAVSEYMQTLKNIDSKAVLNETKKTQQLVTTLDSVSDEKEFCDILLKFYNDTNIQTPWQGNFEDHMLDKNAKLIFK